ncbi:MAG: ABC transporter ATP-binding protein/permease [Oscillospiraceae bacterium]|nr:ABC transporter ATP-binding protein/permease [Oscillospiraceae bacterium]
MRKLFKYLKPFVTGMLLVIALLFGQALCDLNLPNYMSDIVNVGIQQSGVEHAAPEALSWEGVALLRFFMNDDEKALVDRAYVEVIAADADENGVPYTDRYPKAGGTFLLLRDDTNQAELDEAFGTATWALFTMVRDMQAQSGGASGGLMAEGAEAEDLDIALLWRGLQPVLSQLPPAALLAAHDTAAEADPMLIAQSGLTLSRAFYAELGADLGGMQSGYIIHIGLLMLLIALGGGLATVLVSFFASRIAAGVARDLRRAVFAKVSAFSNAEFDKFSTASLITRSTNDITQIQMFLGFGMRLLFYAPIMVTGGVIMAVRKSASMAWILGLACVLLLGLMLIVFVVAMPKFKIMQKLVDKLNLVSRESLSGLMVIRAFGAEAHEKARFAEANGDLAKTSLFVNRVMVVMFPVMMLIMNGVSLFIVWTGAHQIADAAIRVGDMMAFIQYAMQVIMSFLMISMIFIFVPRAAAAAARIAEVLATEPTIRDPEQPKTFDGGKRGLVEFEHVNFRYEGAEEDALHDITFTALPGQTVAFIGSTGSGKSTIANLLLRFYDVTGGQVRLDGLDIREAARNDLRQRIGYVPQQGVLLSGTVASNLKYGAPDISEADMEAAATVAQAAEFITEKEEGYQTDIAQGGTNVSGGQKQRLSIARALAKKPEVFLFDDSFSALDFKTDRALRRALGATVDGGTVLLVAQRVSTIMDAERIIVLDEGRIVGQGTHRELLKSCPQYYEIASSQLSKEELA